MSLSDTALHTQWCRERNADAFTELVYRHSTMVFSTCMRILRNASIAEEAAQDCFIELMNATRPIAPSVGGWLHTVAARRAVDRLRSESSMKSREMAYAAERAASVPPSWDDLSPLIDDAIAALPEEHRMAVVLRFLEGKAHKEIAEELSISQATVRRRLQDGVERLRNDLTGRGIVVGAGVLLAMLEAAPTSAMPANVINTLGKRCLAAQTTAGAAAKTGVFAGVATTSLLSMKLMGAALFLLSIGGLALVFTGKDAPTHVSEAPTGPPADLPAEATPTAALPPAEPAQATLTTAKGPVITGMVVDENNTPVPEAEVIFRELRGATSGPRITTLSGADGRFKLANLEPAERVIVGAKKEGMLWMPTTELHAKLPPDGIHDVVLPVFQAAKLSGRVLDTARKPVADREVTATHKGFDGYETKESVRTDAQGSFSFTALFPGRHELAVIPHAQARDEIVDAEITLVGGESRSAFEIIHPGDASIIAGRVLNDAGVPIEGATVNLMGLSATIRTDDAGQFRFVRVPDNEYSLTAWHEKHGHKGTNVAAGAENVEVVLPEAAPYTVAGRVIAAENAEVIEAFEVYARAGAVEELDAAELGYFKHFDHPEGRFAWEKIPPGVVTVAVRAPGRELNYTIVDPAVSPVDALEIALKKSATVYGVVLDQAGLPVSGAYILQSEFPYLLADRIAKGPAFTERWFGRTAATQSSDDGTFVLDSLIPNLKVITAYHPEHGFRTVAVNPATMEPSEISMSLRPGAVLSGRVTVGGEPLPGAMVTFKLPSDEGEPPQGGAQTEDDGTFKLAGVPAGTLHVSVRMNFPSQSRRGPMNGRVIALWKTTAWGETTEVDVDFPATGTIMEGAVSIEGQAAVSGQVVLCWEQSDIAESAAISIGSDGTYRFDDIPAGNVSIALQGRLDPSAMRGRAATATLMPGVVNHLDFALDGGTKVHGRVLGLLPEESGVSIRAYDQDVDLFGGDTLSIVSALRAYGRMTDEGFYALEGLTPGTYLLSVSALKQDSTGHMIDSRRMESILTINESTGPALVSDLILD